MRPCELPDFRRQVLSIYERTHAELAGAEVAAARDARAAEKETHPRLAKAKHNLAEGTAEVVRHLKALREIQAPAHLQPLWQMAEMFWVTPEMSSLATEAEKTMPGFELHRDDLPADIGIIYFPMVRVINAAGEADHECDVAALWGPDWSDSTTSTGITLVIYTVHRKGTIDVLPVIRVHIEYGQDMITSAKHPQAGIQWARLVRCCWLLMQQRVATVTEERPDRASLRRLTRAGQPVDPVRVISLRRASSSNPNHDSTREFHHRWVVRGHWRKQWYATQERHVPIWIAPFIKGPDDAPLLGGEKVYAWRK